MKRYRKIAIETNCNSGFILMEFFVKKKILDVNIRKVKQKRLTQL